MPDLDYIPTLFVLACIGVVLGLYEVGRFVWFVAHHVQIIG